MDGRSDHPTHVVAKNRINAHLRTWEAEHPQWPATLEIPLDPEIPWRLLMVFHHDDDPIDRVWYTSYLLRPNLLQHLGDPHVLADASFHHLNLILLMMQRDIGQLRRKDEHGAYPAI